MDGWSQQRIRTRPALFARVLLVTLPGLVGGWGFCAHAADHRQDDPLLKAAYVYNFAKFTSWPKGVWRDPESPLVLCTSGVDSILPALERLSEERVAGRRVEIRPDTNKTTGCHILFITTKEHSNEAHWIESVRSQPVLTISEHPGFAQSGGMIELFRKNERLRFRINIRAVRAGGLTLSSRLLGLAEIIGLYDEPPP